MKRMPGFVNFIYLFMRDLLPSDNFSINILHLQFVLIEAAQLALPELGPHLLVLLPFGFFIMVLVFAFHPPLPCEKLFAVVWPVWQGDEVILHNILVFGGEGAIVPPGYREIRAHFQLWLCFELHGLLYYYNLTIQSLLFAIFYQQINGKCCLKPKIKKSMKKTLDFAFSFESTSLFNVILLIIPNQCERLHQVEIDKFKLSKPKEKKTKLQNDTQNQKLFKRASNRNQLFQRAM